MPNLEEHSLTSSLGFILIGCSAFGFGWTLIGLFFIQDISFVIVSLILGITSALTAKYIFDSTIFKQRAVA